MIMDYCFCFLLVMKEKLFVRGNFIIEINNWLSIWEYVIFYDMVV